MPMLLPIFASNESSRPRERVAGLYVALSLAFAVGLSPTFGTAHAADAATPPPWSQLPLKAPWQPSVIQSYDWTGLYVGAHLGYAGGRSNWSTPPDLASSLDLFQSSDIFTGSGSYFGGLQIGYDFMLANRVVLGVQLDASFPGFPRHGASIAGTSIFSTPEVGLRRYSETVLHSGTC